MIDGLLARLAPSEGDMESLVGDIVEEYRRRRSLRWLMVQIGGAVAIGAGQSIRKTPWRAISGIGVGLPSLWSALAVATMVLKAADFPPTAAWRWWHCVLILAVGAAGAIWSGWIVARMHREARLVAMSGFMASLVILSMLELPLLYIVQPVLFWKTVVPLLPMVGVAAVCAPFIVLMGGFVDLYGCRKPSRRSGER